jgi:hypothetical protein
LAIRSDQPGISLSMGDLRGNKEDQKEGGQREPVLNPHGGVLRQFWVVQVYSSSIGMFPIFKTLETHHHEEWRKGIKSGIMCPWMFC